MNGLNRLLFQVSLLDRMSGPARGMMNTMNTVTTEIQGGFNKIGYGAAGLAGAAYSLDDILQPAKEMQTALGEISSMNVGQDVLDKLNSTALKFSVQYGESAAEFVSSAYDIQGAISGLSGNELPAFTNASAILAKGTKADMATITNYVGTMYGIFQDKADAMGKAGWINMMAGQTAVAVNIFKTTGQGMSEAFTTLGAGAHTMGVGMAEQMSILGTLQATMSGSEAGTKYRAFLDGVGNAQDKLGLKFTDNQGKMLPMVDILEKIKGKYGAIDTVAKSDLLKKAFGTQEATALVKLLSINIDGLSNSINEVGKQTGLQGAIDMAKAMTMPWEKAKSAGNALIIMLGQKMLPVLTPVYNGITSVSETLMRWMTLFPNITTYIGYAVFGVIGIIAALSALSVIVGISTLVMTGFGLVMAIITSPITATIVAIAAIGYAIYRLLDIWAQWAYGMSIFDTMAAGYEAAKLGVVSMIETTVAAFTSLKNWFNSFNLWESLLSGADQLIGLLNKIPGVNIDLGGTVKPLPANLDTPAAITGPQTVAPSLSVMAAQPAWTQQSPPGLLTDGFAPQQPVMQQPVLANPAAQPPVLVNLAAPAAVAQPAPVAQPTVLVNQAAPAAVAQPPVMANLSAPEAIAQPVPVAQPPVLVNLAAPAAVAQPAPVAQPTVLVNQAAPAAIAQPAPVAQPPVLVNLAAPAAIVQPAPVAAQPKWLQQPPAGTLTDGFAPPKPVAAPAALSQSQTANVPKGGIMSQINNADNSKSISVGGITVNNYSQPVTGQRLADEIAMAAG